ncbi:hypothetical protein A6R68_22851 [Neotoma lepida]|uniref:Uncharacterized protein n=1 Tax=Neotoma lepida TaxID=56216 RepID=A0A1A6HY68_NEOLE|nr:hypothetical protein A6R68_22851 [Neotoma lepida]
MVWDSVSSHEQQSLWRQSEPSSVGSPAQEPAKCHKFLETVELQMGLKNGLLQPALFQILQLHSFLPKSYNTSGG